MASQLLTRLPQRIKPRLGLVCITASEQCRYHALTRARSFAMGKAQRRSTLERLYWDNLLRFQGALSFCRRHDIRLYRVTSNLFPMSDESLGISVLQGMRANLSAVGRRALRLGIRVVAHPDQFVVLNSESSKVVKTSAVILEKHALAFDLLGLDSSPWAALIIHGGKSGRGEELLENIAKLSSSVRNRLVLENDEYAYGAADILGLCRRGQIPMVFDAHHHIVKEHLDSYEHPSVAQLTRAARSTWPKPSWQMVHLSNGRQAFGDRHHSELIAAFPSAYQRVPWIEVEARGKEHAIAQLRADRPNLR